MKFIGALQGVCVVRYALEEVLPKTGAQLPKIAEVVRATYQVKPTPTIVQSPTMRATSALLPTMTFANGQLMVGDETYSVAKIVISDIGLMTVSQNTESAEKIMDHLISLLDSSLGFSIATAVAKRLYVSAVVVQFEREFEKHIEPIKNICGIVKKLTGREHDVALKRLVFGSADDPGAIVTPDTVEKTDFVIERRVNSPFSENRYFSSAPLSTSGHLAALQQIEAAIPEA